MKGRKNILRVGTFITILLFLFIPILSSPAVAFIDSSGSAATNNTAGGPTASATVPVTPPPVTYSKSRPPIATFRCSFSFVDSNGGGQGSEHEAILTVQRISPTPKGQIISDSFSWTLEPWGTKSGMLEVQDGYDYGVETIWEVVVTAYCKDIATGPPGALNSGSYTVKVSA